MNDDTIILGDIHGAANTMIRLLNRAPKGLKVVFHGDLIDRGPNSRKVVEFAMENKILTCSGNHEDLALAYSKHKKRGYIARCASYYDHDVWLYNGGYDALGNWPHIDEKGRRDGEFIPDEVLRWMAALPPYLYPSDQLDEDGRKLLVSHTGYGLNADSDNWISALWGRYPDDGPFAWTPETYKERDDGLYRVFGHTRVSKIVVGERFTNIDLGAAYKQTATLGAFLWPSKTVMTEPFNESPCDPTFAIVDGRLT